MYEELKNLAKKALKLAIKDYISALELENTEIINECEEFFNSEQFGLLTECAEMREMDSNYIMGLCKKAVGMK